VVAELLEVGCSVLFADLRVSWSDAPFSYLYDDTDLEALGGGGALDAGRVVSVDDAQMGWSRYAQSLAIQALNPNLFYLSATYESVAYARKCLARIQALGKDASEQDIAFVMTDEAISPSHDGVRRAGISVRLLDGRCFGNGHGSVAAAPLVGSSHGAQHNPQAILSSRNFAAKALVLTHGCSPVAPSPGDPPPRPMNWVIPKSDPWPPQAICASLGLESLCETVARVAVNREVIAAVSNKNIFHMLQLFVNGIKTAGVKNGMVVALDDETSQWLEARNVPHYIKKIRSRSGSTDNHATSGLKFKILVDFLSVGCSVLLSDVDVIWLTDPMPFLYRDADVSAAAFL